MLHWWRHFQWDKLRASLSLNGFRISGLWLLSYDRYEYSLLKVPFTRYNLRINKVLFHVHSQKAGTVVITNADVNSRGRTGTLL